MKQICATEFILPAEVKANNMEGYIHYSGLKVGFSYLIVLHQDPYIQICSWYLFINISKTCPCNIQRYFSAVKIENFIGKLLIF